MEGGAGPTAQFRFSTDNGTQFLQLLVSIEVDPVSPFALAASWRSLKKNLQSHGSMKIPDVIVEGVRPIVQKSEFHSQALELDLEHYEVPTPNASASSALQYPSDRAAEPTDLHRSVSLPAPFYGESRLYRIRGGDTTVPSDMTSPETLKRPSFKKRNAFVKVGG